MASQSPFLLVKQLETLLRNLLGVIDVDSLPLAAQRIIQALRQEIVEARLDIRDYELSETRSEQLNNAEQAKRRLEGLRKNILAVSEQAVFGPADVAQVTANIERIMIQLQ